MGKKKCTENQLKDFLTERDLKLHNNENILNLNNEINKDSYMVYILTSNEDAIIAGHGRRDRWKILLDSEYNVTRGHIKSFLLRYYVLKKKDKIERFLIECDGKKDAMKIEKEIHKIFGGDCNQLKNENHDWLYGSFKEDSQEYLILKLSEFSGYSGISDLFRWKKKGIINEGIWKEINNKLKLVRD